MPTAPFLPILHEYLAENDVGVLHDEERPRYSAPMHRLAERVGVPESRIYDLARGRQQIVDFNFIDLLLCKMGLPHLWIEDAALREIYYGVQFEEEVCPNGHPRTPENTSTKGGARRCLVCNREGLRRYRERKRERAAGAA